MAVRFAVVDRDAIDAIPSPALPGALCQTCDYWERIDGRRDQPDTPAARDLKRGRLLAGEALAGAYAMIARDGDEVIGFAQFGPMAAYPRAGTIRDRYPDLPDSPAPWVVTCLQVADRPNRHEVARELAEAISQELGRRGIIAVEAYPEAAADPWHPPSGPAAIYAAAGFSQVAGDERYPVFRRELGDVEAEVDWGDLLSRTRPSSDDDAWPIPPKSGPTEDDLFRPPPKSTKPNPFGED